jgi:uncharacterized repeat protein (TIGR03803 family)
MLGKERVLYRFRGGNDGAQPGGSLIFANGALYGTTLGGGPYCHHHGCGTIFQFQGGKERVLYSFKGGSDGNMPTGNLVYANGMLYGTTFGLGDPQCRCGTIFQVSTSGDERPIYSFKGRPDASLPSGGLLVMNGLLFGTTQSGGSSNQGTIFESSTSGTESVLYSFASTGVGPKPNGNLISVNGTIYGTTLHGGDASNYCCGTVFQFGNPRLSQLSESLGKDGR